MQFSSFFFTVLLLLTLAWTLPSVPAAASDRMRIEWFSPKPEKPVTFYDQNGQAIELESFRGKTVILNLWATWCPPCVEELPSLVKLHQNYAAKGLAVVALSQDSKGFETITPFWSNQKLGELPLYRDENGRTLRQFKVEGLPTTLFFNGEGQLFGVLEGSVDWQSPSMKTIIEKKLLPASQSKTGKR